LICYIIPSVIHARCCRGSTGRGIFRNNPVDLLVTFFFVRFYSFFIIISVGLYGLGWLPIHLHLIELFAVFLRELLRIWVDLEFYFSNLWSYQLEMHVGSDTTLRNDQWRKLNWKAQAEYSDAKEVQIPYGDNTAVLFLSFTFITNYLLKHQFFSLIKLRPNYFYLLSQPKLPLAIRNALLYAGPPTLVFNHGSSLNIGVFLLLELPNFPIIFLSILFFKLFSSLFVANSVYFIISLAACVYPGEGDRDCVNSTLDLMGGISSVSKLRLKGSFTSNPFFLNSSFYSFYSSL